MAKVELEKRLSEQTLVYSTSKDIIKANNANWEMTKLIVRIQKIKGIKI